MNDQFFAAKENELIYAKFPLTLGQERFRRFISSFKLRLIGSITPKEICTAKDKIIIPVI